MTSRSMTAVLLLAALPLAAFAEEPAPAAAPAAPAESPAPAMPGTPGMPMAPETAPPGDQTAGTPGETPAPTPGKRGCDMKGKGMGMGMGMMGGPGMGPGKGCGCPGHAPMAMHQDVTDRLDLIEARLAKIEAMLEGLMRR